MSISPPPALLRITCVIPSLGCGGAERVMVGLCGRLAELGHTVSLLTTESGVPDFFTPPENVRRRTLPAGLRTSCRWWDLPCQRRRTGALREAILGERPDLVISFLDTTNVAVLLALAGSGIPVLVAEHIDPRLHPIGWRWSALRRLIYPKAGRVVVLTEETRRWARTVWPRWRLAVIPNPVETLAPAPASVRPAYFGTRTLAAMGRLAPQKGFDRLIRVFATLATRFEDWKLVIFGEGDERGNLERLIADLGLSGRVHLPGIVREPQRILPLADLFVLSSRYEGFPLVLVEAMALGLPVVSFACPSGPAEIVRDGIDGLLVPAENVDALAAAMARLMADDAERHRLGRSAAEIGTRFAPERILALWQALIAEVMTEQRANCPERSASTGL